MVSITASVDPTTVVETRDNPSETYGHIPVITFDDVNVYLGGMTTPEDADAKIIASADLLIGKLTELRDSAAKRADLAAIDAASPAEGHEVVAEWTRGEALPDGVEFVGTVGQFLDAITDQAPGELVEAWGK